MSNHECGRSGGDKVHVSMGNNSSKNSEIKILTPHAHLRIIGRKSTKFQMNLTEAREEVEDIISELHSVYQYIYYVK